MIIIAPKKNRTKYGDQYFHVTTGGVVLPVPAKVDKTFQNCMSDELKGNMITGEKLTKTQKKSNRNKFASAVKACKTEAPKPKGRPKAA